MIKDISYSGLSTVPSDYEAPDGHLAAAVNIIPEDGALRRIYPPSVHFTPPAGHTPVFIHKLSGGEVFYILFNNDDDTLSAIKQNDTEPLPILTISADSTLTQITAIGNTLVILTSAGIYFAKWDNISQSYQSLPAEFPEFPLQFSLTDGKEEIPSFDIPSQPASPTGAPTSPTKARPQSQTPSSGKSTRQSPRPHNKAASSSHSSSATHCASTTALSSTTQRLSSSAPLSATLSPQQCQT